MKVLLINPQRSLKTPDRFVSIPYELAGLAHFLMINGHETDILDTVGEDFLTKELINGVYKCGLPDDKVSKLIEDFKPQIVCISCPNIQRYPNVVNISKIVKKLNPETLVTIEGLYATINATEIIKEPTIDFIIMGEVEITFLNLLNKVKSNNRDASDLKAVSYKSGEGVFVSPDRILIDALDTLPPPAYELLPLENYFKYSKHDSLTKHKRQISMITSRGCVHKCGNCASANIWGQVWRAKSVPFLLIELEILLDIYKIQEVNFEDLSMTGDIPRIHSLCREIVHRNLQFKWSVYLHNQELDLQTKRLMIQAGCQRFHFGAESEEKSIFPCKTI